MSRDVIRTIRAPVGTAQRAQFALLGFVDTQPVPLVAATIEVGQVLIIPTSGFPDNPSCADDVEFGAS